MPLESATYISDLIATNPDGSDQGKFGDDHIRMLKSVLQNSFPNIGGAVTASHTALNNLPVDANAELSTINDGITAIETNPVASDAAQKAVIDVIYPVGSVFIAVSLITPPSATGVTWERIAEGRTLVGEGTGQDDNLAFKTFNIGATGGEYDHQLTVAEIPNHSHKTDGTDGGDKHPVRAGFDAEIDFFSSKASSNDARYTTGSKTGATGGDEAHNNIQPYLVTYIWERTA